MSVQVRVHFAGLSPGRPLYLFARAGLAGRLGLGGVGGTASGRELEAAFGRHWSVVDDARDCDVVVYPHEYTAGPETAAVSALAGAARKPCIFFSGDEDLPPSEISYGVLYRASIFDRRPHERALPMFVGDIRAEPAVPPAEALPWVESPCVGFCGYVGTAASRAFYRLIGATQKADGLRIRHRILQSLRRSGVIDCRFIERSGYMGSAMLAAKDKTHRLADARQEFLSNLLECPYNICVRGKGNHSVRFYETLAAGRIPLFVNTNCVLPFEGEIDWRRHVLWVEDSEIPRIGEAVRRGHHAVTPDGFRELQLRNRALWLDRLRPEPYFRHVLSAIAAGHPAP